MAPPAFPDEAIETASTPSSQARETATANPRALKVPVGFSSSFLMNRPANPPLRWSSGQAAWPSLVAWTSGVKPSPRQRA